MLGWVEAQADRATERCPSGWRASTADRGELRGAGCVGDCLPGRKRAIEIIDELNRGFAIASPAPNARLPPAAAP